MAEDLCGDTRVSQIVTVVDVERQEEGARQQLHPDTRRRALLRVVKVAQLLRRAVIHAVHHWTSQCAGHSHLERLVLNRKQKTGIISIITTEIVSHLSINGNSRKKKFPILREKKK